MKLRLALLVAALIRVTNSQAAAQDVQPAAGTSPATTLSSLVGAARDDATTQTFRLLDRNATWTKVGQVPVDFRTFHTEGLVKVGDAFFVSATEILGSTQKNGLSTDSLYDFTIDRSVGAGRGWLFKFDTKGHLLGKVELGADSVYHPGGIDFDGRYIVTVHAP